mgnify:CR=1 FL=1
MICRIYSLSVLTAGVDGISYLFIREIQPWGLFKLSAVRNGAFQLSALYSSWAEAADIEDCVIQRRVCGQSDLGHLWLWGLNCSYSGHLQQFHTASLLKIMARRIGAAGMILTCMENPDWRVSGPIDSSDSDASEYCSAPLCGEKRRDVELRMYNRYYTLYPDRSQQQIRSVKASRWQSCLWGIRYSKRRQLLKPSWAPTWPVDSVACDNMKSCNSFIQFLRVKISWVEFRATGDST